MVQMYKVFYYDRELIVTSDKSNVHGEVLIDTTVMKTSCSQLKAAVETFLQTPSMKKIFIIGDDLDILLRDLRSCFKPLTAAGGLVKNNKDQYLFIYRLKRWDLPKGKAEKGETIEETACREVEEECGITNLRIENKLCETYHFYEKDKVRIFKTTHWYAMKYDGNEALVPQTKENIEKAEWLTKAEWAKVFGNTYPSIIEVLCFGGCFDKLSNPLL